jgi:hypothetical protein
MRQTVVVERFRCPATCSNVVLSLGGMASNASKSKFIFFLPDLSFLLFFTPVMPPPFLASYHTLCTTLLGHSQAIATALDTPCFNLLPVPLRATISAYMCLLSFVLYCCLVSLFDIASECIAQIIREEIHTSSNRS